jgi:hypothetical protein
MRVNIGHVLPVCAALFVLAFGSRKQPMRLASFLLFELLAAVILFSIYGLSWSTILIVPASLFRDGFHLNSLSLTQIDLFLFCFVGMANAVWIYGAAMERRNGEVVVARPIGRMRERYRKAEKGARLAEYYEKEDLRRGHERGQAR